MAKLSLITAPTQRLVEAAELRLHARIDHTEEDELLEMLLDAAEAAAEQYTWRRFLTQTWDQYFDGFADPLYLAHAPLQSVSSITYTDSNGDSQTLSTDVYEEGDEDDRPLVRRQYDEDWPTTQGHADVVTVRFVCGYGDVDDVPAQIKQAVRTHAAWHFRNREGQPILDGFYGLLSPYRMARWETVPA